MNEAAFLLETPETSIGSLGESRIARWVPGGLEYDSELRPPKVQRVILSMVIYFNVHSPPQL